MSTNCDGGLVFPNLQAAVIFWLGRALVYPLLFRWLHIDRLLLYINRFTVISSVVGGQGIEQQATCQYTQGDFAAVAPVMTIAMPVIVTSVVMPAAVVAIISIVVLLMVFAIRLVMVSSIIFIIFVMTNIILLMATIPVIGKSL
ncbi:hypothetical protein CRD36_15800 [Paremcibacter congregatus]|uniref:Uncharacterized protein n=1 Tax=Paremcibacter congregatus TaxID=2043170 RepID=A0A2G4YNE6_9PROT|nr:hypothetical protein CRD36_15800 [Paremcibacter congregatus]